MSDPVIQVIEDWLADAWDEGYGDGASFDDGLGEYVPKEANPYRKQARGRFR